MEEDATIRFRLSNIDLIQHYDGRDNSVYDNRISPFYRDQDGKATRLNAVPILRIFGATDRGQRVVAFVHSFFPYLFINYDGKLDPDSLNTYIYRLARAMNHALKTSYKTKNANGSARPAQYIAFIVPCKAIPIYGYHVGYRPYLKVYLADPKVKTRLAELLRSGVLMKTEFEVYEDHLPPILQFMIDANLLGSGWVEVAQCLFRRPLPSYIATASAEYDPPTCRGVFSGRTYNEYTVPLDLIHPSDGPDKVSYCPLELDFPLEAILNRHRLSQRDLHHDFVEKLQPDLLSQMLEGAKYIPSLAELYDDEYRRCRQRGEQGPTDFVVKPSSFTTREEKLPLWQSEERLRKVLTARIEKDLPAFSSQSGLKSRRPDFSTFVSDDEKARGVEKGYLARLRTSFEQVTALHDTTLEKDERELYEYGAWAVRGMGIERGKREETVSLEVDEARMANIQIKLEDPDEDAEGLREMRREASEADEDPEDDEVGEQQEEEGVLVEESGIEGAAAADESESGQPPAKKVKRDTSISQDDDLSPPPPHQRSPEPAEQPSPPFLEQPPAAQRPASLGHNPFSSPDKKVRVIFARQDTTPSPPPAQRQPSPDVDMAFLVPDACLDPPDLETNQSTHIHDDLFDGLPSDTFEDYQPTPTIAVPVPSVLPPELRSDFSLDHNAVLETPSPSPSSSAPMLTPGGRTQPQSPISELVPIRATTIESIDDAVSSSVEKSAPDQLELEDVKPAVQAECADSSLPISSDHTTAPCSLPVPSTSSDKRISRGPLAKNCYIWASMPPTTHELSASFASFGKAQIVYKEPHYSTRADVPARAREYGGMSWKLRGTTLEFLDPFLHWPNVMPVPRPPPPKPPKTRTTTVWELRGLPPSRKEVQHWLEAQRLGDQRTVRKQREAVTAQIEGPTQVDGGFRFIPAKVSDEQREKQHLSVLTIELHINTRGKLLPDPEHDDIGALFYCFQSEDDDLEGNGRADDRLVGCIVVGHSDFARSIGRTSFRVDVVEAEIDLINLFIDKVRYEWDPEIVAGFEVHNASWGFLIERADKHLSFNIVNELGRLSEGANGKFGDRVTDRWGFNESTTLSFPGRHVFAIWRVLKADNSFARNSFEYVIFQILHHRTPRYSFETLTKWWKDGPQGARRVLEYWRNRVEMCIEILEEAETVAMNSESARVFGIDFKSVRTRGSQFKVESIMFRIAKPESLMLVSPNRVQVGRQNAAECQPLVMEPKSAFFKGPMLVLDFQSLYPSIMIAYNLCYSTCLGRVETFKGTGKLGTSTYDPRPGLLHLLKDDIHISPNGMIFVKSNVRKSLLAKMLNELLDTRVMVKTGMKSEKDKAVLRLLNARQLALKYLANVTYGYTSATFSGRMPCVEIADAIVQTGRETLERAFETIRTNSAWGAQVVYGDTDSLFVYLPGRSKEDAFRIGNEIAETVTSQNPRPVKLKFEKVYLPSVLLAKKRYVGFKYEHLSDVEPDFDAKGIETVRRDGIYGLQKMQETCLKLLFRTSDLSLVKEYCQRQWRKLMTGDVSPMDFTYAKKVRLGTYSTKGPPPVGAAVAARMMKADPRGEPGYGERVPYIIIQGESKLQVNRSVTPAEFMADARLRLDVTHYIEKAMIPPLERIFNLVGADVKSWYHSLQKTSHAVNFEDEDVGKPALLEQYYVVNRCWGCGGHGGKDGLCDQCRERPGHVALAVATKASAVIKQRQALHQLCASCSSTPPHLDIVACESFDCPVFYQRKKADADAALAQKLLSKLRIL